VDAVLLVVGGAVGVQVGVGLPRAVRDRRERLVHALSARVADVGHRAEHRRHAVAVDGLLQQPLAEVEVRADRLHVGEQQVPEAAVVEDERPGLLHRLARLVQRARRDDEAVLVEIRLLRGEAAGDRAAHVEVVGLERHERDDVLSGEDRPDEQQVVDVRPGPVGIVGDDHVAALQPVDPVLLDRDPDRLGHRAREEDDRVAHRRGRVAGARRPRHRGGEVVEVPQDRRERGREQLAAHVLDDVAEAVAQHRRGETVAAEALLERRLVEVADQRALFGDGHVSSPLRGGR
jgi:hypothetical protein